MFRYMTSTMSFPKLFRTMEMRGKISPKEEEKIKEVAGYEAEICQIEELKLPQLHRARLQSTDGFSMDSLLLDAWIEYFNGRLNALRNFIILAQRE